MPLFSNRSQFCFILKPISPVFRFPPVCLCPAWRSGVSVRAVASARLLPCSSAPRSPNCTLFFFFTHPDSRHPPHSVQCQSKSCILTNTTSFFFSLQTPLTQAIKRCVTVRTIYDEDVHRKYGKHKIVPVSDSLMK